jgi:hypothetical protein
MMRVDGVLTRDFIYGESSALAELKNLSVHNEQIEVPK